MPEPEQTPRRRPRPSPAIAIHTSAMPAGAQEAMAAGIARAMPTQAVADGTPLTHTLDYTADRLDRLEVVIANLERQLIPVLDDELANYLDSPIAEESAPEPLPRAYSTRIGRLGDHADRLGDRLAQLRDHLEV